MFLFVKKIIDALADPRVRSFLVGVALVVLLALLLRQCGETRAARQQVERERAIAAQNVAALTDSLHTARNRAGQVESFKAAFVTRMEDLEKLNAEMFQMVRNTAGDIKDVESLISAQAHASSGDITVSNSLDRIDTNTWGLRFDASRGDTGATFRVKGVSRFTLASGRIEPGSTTVDAEVRMGLVMGFRETSDRYEVFATPASPMVKIDKLDGVTFIKKPKPGDITVDPVKPKRFGIGVQLGWGYTPGGYFFPYLGAGVSYNIIRF